LEEKSTSHGLGLPEAQTNLYDFFELHSLHCIRAAIAALIDAGILERRNNPGNFQDKTYQYRVNVTALNATDGSDDSDVSSEPLYSAESEPSNEDSSLKVENSTAENHTDNLIKKSISQILSKLETEEKEIRDLDILKSKIGNFVVTTPNTPHPVFEKQATLPTPVINKDEIPEDLKNKLEELEIPFDKKVRNAIASHHISQAWGAVNHIENTWETIENPRGVFLYQIGKQPVEPIGTRVKEYVPSDITLDYLKFMYPNSWKEAASHFGIDWSL
jgi:hypothetical protein